MNMRRLRKVVQKCMYRTVMMNMLGITMAKHLHESAQRKGFVRRFLEDTLGLTTHDVVPNLVKYEDAPIQPMPPASGVIYTVSPTLERTPTREEILSQPTYLYPNKPPA